MRFQTIMNIFALNISTKKSEVRNSSVDIAFIIDITDRTIWVNYHLRQNI